MATHHQANEHSGNGGLLRSHYFPRQLVTAADLTTDQRYEQQLWRLHNQHLIGCGVVCGLEVFFAEAVAPVNSANQTALLQLKVTPGYAISPQGDSIVVPTEQTLPLDCHFQIDFCENPDATLIAQQRYLVIRYREVGTCPVPASPERCVPAITCEFSRIQASFEITCLPTLPTTCSNPAIDCHTVIGEVIQGQRIYPDSPAAIPTLFTCPPTTTDEWIVLATIHLSIDGQFSLSYADRAQLTPTRFLKEILRCLPGQRYQPLIESIEPATGQPGTNPLAIIKGQRLSGASAVEFFQIGVTAQILKPGDRLVDKEYYGYYSARALFSPDGQRLAIPPNYNTVNIWEAATGKEIASMPHASPVNWMHFSPDGRFLATATFERVYLWNAANGEELARFGNLNSNSGIFTPNGQYLITTDYDNATASYVVWNGRNGQFIRTLFNSSSYPYENRVALSPDGHFLAVGESVGTNNILRVWLVATGELLANLPHPSGDDQIDRVTFSADGAYLISKTYKSSAPSRSIVRVWVPTTGEVISQTQYSYSVDLALSPNGRYFALWGYSYTTNAPVLSLLTIPGQQITQIYLEGTSSIYNPVFSPNSLYLVAQQYDSVVRNYIAKIWSVDTGEQLAQINPGNYYSQHTFSPDGDYLGLAIGNTVRLYRVATDLEIIRINQTTNSYISQFFFNRDGTYLVTQNYSNLEVRVGIVSSDTHLPIRMKIEHEAPIGQYGFQVVAPKGIADSRDFSVSFQVVPEIARISPPSSPPGRTLMASIIGRGLAGVTAAQFSGIGISARVLPGGSHSVVRVELTISQNAPLGSQTFQVTTPSGVVDSADFRVGFLVYGYSYSYGKGLVQGIGGELIDSWEDR